METKVLTTDEVKDLLLGPDREQVRHSERLEMCSIMEILEVTEHRRKHGDTSNAAEFVEQIKQITRSGVVVLDLSGERLAQSLFDGQRGETPEIWSLALDTSVSTAKTIRRLASRVDSSAWWSFEVFEEFESRECAQR